MRPGRGHAFPVPSRNEGLSGSKSTPVKGSLKKTQFGFSMPVAAPLFPRPPFLYKDATLMIFEYETELEMASRLLPEVDGLFLNDQPHTSGAGLVFASYPWSNPGPYKEVVQHLRVLYKGQPMQYAAFLYVTSDAAMAAGPEMGGYPRKIGRIAFLPGPDYAAVMERPAGLRLGSGTMRPEKLLEPETLPFYLPRPLPLNYLAIQVIPSPQLDAPRRRSSSWRRTGRSTGARRGPARARASSPAPRRSTRSTCPRSRHRVTPSCSGVTSTYPSTIDRASARSEPIAPPPRIAQPA
jgi:hypothetical protein